MPIFTCELQVAGKVDKNVKKWIILNLAFLKKYFYSQLLDGVRLENGRRYRAPGANLIKSLHV
jgi:hypothetical protein